MLFCRSFRSFHGNPEHSAKEPYLTAEAAHWTGQLRASAGWARLLELVGVLPRSTLLQLATSVHLAGLGGELEHALLPVSKSLSIPKVCPFWMTMQ